MPQFLGPVRGDGGEQLDDGAGDLCVLGSQRLVCAASLQRRQAQVGTSGVHQLHDGAERGVELVAAKVLLDLGDNAVALAQERLGGLSDIALGIRFEEGVPARSASQIAHGAPSAVEELVDARQALLVPQQLLVGRRHEQDAGAHGICAVAGDHAFRGDDVALGLGHDVTVLVEHHALAQQVGEGLVEAQHVHVAQDLGEEARVQQVQDRVLDAADVLVDGHEAVHLVLGKGLFGVVGVGVAQVVPRAAGEGVHGVGLAARRLAAHRAGARGKLLVRCQGLTRSKVDVFGEAHGQVLFGDGHNATLIAVDGGDGVTPIALAADEPVPQAELDFALAATHGLELGDDGFLGRGVLAAHEAGELAGLHEDALGGHGLGPVDARDNAALLILELRVKGVVFGDDDGDDGKIVLLGKLEVALVAAGDGHDGTSAIVRNDVVRNPNRDLLAVDGVHHIAAGEGAVLLLAALSALDGSDLLGVIDHLHDSFLVRSALNEALEDGALGGEQEEAAAKERVCAGGENGEELVLGGLGGNGAICIAEGEGHLGAF